MPIKAFESLPGYRYDPVSQRYRDAGTGRFVSFQRIYRLVDLNENSQAATMQAVTAEFLAGNLDAPHWYLAMTNQQRVLTVQQAALGAGGFDNIRPADFRRIEDQLRDDFQRLLRFGRQIEVGSVSPGQAQVRVNMYVGRARTQFYLSQPPPLLRAGEMAIERRVLHPAEHCEWCVYLADLGWQPYGTLPAPCESSATWQGTQCLTNCKCGLERRILPIAEAKLLLSARRFDPSAIKALSHPSPFAGTADRFSDRDYLQMASDAARNEDYEIAGLTINGYGSEQYTSTGGQGAAVNVGKLLDILGHFHEKGIVQSAHLIHTHPRPADKEDYEPFGIMQDLAVFVDAARNKGLQRMTIIDAQGRLQALQARSIAEHGFDVIDRYNALYGLVRRRYEEKQGRSPGTEDQDRLLRLVNEKICTELGIRYEVTPAVAKLVKGGVGSGNFGHAGRPGERGGSAPAGETTVLDKALAEIETGHSHSLMAGRGIWQSHFTDLGYDETAVQEAFSLLNAYGRTKPMQERAVTEILAHLQAQDDVGQVLAEQIRVETKLAQKIVDSVDRWWGQRKANLEDDWAFEEKLAPKGTAYFVGGEWVDRADKQSFFDTEERIFKREVLRIYRKGETGGQIESWTSNPRGAWLGHGQGSMGVDHELNLADALKTYDVLGGYAKMMGAPGEAEVTLIRKDAWRKSVKLHAIKGGPGSGNFGHAGRPGEVGGSAPDGTSAPAADTQEKNPSFSFPTADDLMAANWSSLRTDGEEKETLAEGVWMVSTPDGRRWFVKQASTEKSSVFPSEALNEKAAAILGEALGLPVIPVDVIDDPKVLAGHLLPDGQPELMISPWLNTAEQVGNRYFSVPNRLVDYLETHAPELQKMEIYDYLIRNTDRHAGNLMADRGAGKPIFIDQGLSFSDKAKGEQNSLHWFIRDKHITDYEIFDQDMVDWLSDGIDKASKAATTPEIRRRIEFAGLRLQNMIKEYNSISDGQSVMGDNLGGIEWGELRDTLTDNW